jgi:ABC-type multidrug transport system permease subunit
MVFASGVVYPIEFMPRFLQIFAHILPLTYAVKGLKSVSDLGTTSLPALHAAILLGFFTLFLFPAVKLLGKKFQ